MPIATRTALETDTRSLEKGYQALFAGFVSVNPNASVGSFIKTPEWDMIQPTLKLLRVRHKAHEGDVTQLAIAVLQRPTNMFTKPVTDANHLAKPTLATQWQLTPHGRSHFPRRPSTLVPVQEAIPGPQGLGQKRQWWDDDE